MDEARRYDLRMWSWPRVREIVWDPSRETEVDVSEGHLFPWWLLFGCTGRLRPLLDRGVTRVVLWGRSLVVTLLDGEVSVFSDRFGSLHLEEKEIEASGDVAVSSSQVERAGDESMTLFTSPSP